MVLHLHLEHVQLITVYLEKFMLVQIQQLHQLIMKYILLMQVVVLRLKFLQHQTHI